jgi:hypothetical protein
VEQVDETRFLAEAGALECGTDGEKVTPTFDVTAIRRV